MAILKSGVFCVIAVSLLATSFTPVLADNRSDFRGQVAIVMAALDRSTAQSNRVVQIKPVPRTDAALCAAVNKFIHEAQMAQGYEDKKCFASEAKFNEFGTSLQRLINSQSKTAGLFHCPH